MKAIQYVGYGDTDVIRLTNIEKPVPKDDEVLIRVAATTVNPLNIKIRSGKMQQPKSTRVQLAPIKLAYTPGLDFAGTLEAVGQHVTRLKVGDQVYGGTRGGTYAEYIAVAENLVAQMPNSLTLNESTALAGSLTASPPYK